MLSTAACENKRLCPAHPFPPDCKLGKTNTTSRRHMDICMYIRNSIKVHGYLQNDAKEPFSRTNCRLNKYDGSPPLVTAIHGKRSPCRTKSSSAAIASLSSIHTDTPPPSPPSPSSLPLSASETTSSAFTYSVIIHIHIGHRRHGRARQRWVTSAKIKTAREKTPG